MTACWRAYSNGDDVNDGKPGGQRTMVFPPQIERTLGFVSSLTLYGNTGQTHTNKTNNSHPSTSDPPPIMSTTLSTLLKPLLEVTNDRLIHSDGPERLEYWSAFQKIWDIYPENDVPHGELYIRHMIGNILFLVTRAVELDKGKVVPSLEGSFPNSPLEAWSVEDWDMFAEYITATADCLKRMDASATAGDMEDPTPDPERCEVPALTDKLEKILRYIKVYKITAPIRGLLMEQFKDITKTKDKLPKLPKKKVEEVWSYCLKEKDLMVQEQFFRKIFETKEDDDETKPAQFMTIGELKEAFSDKPFTFDRFDDRIDVLMVEWCTLFLSEPRLSPFYFPDNVEEIVERRNPAEVMNNLRTKRRNLRNTGEDPLEESLRLAETAVAPPRKTVAAEPPRDPPDSRRASSLYKRKRSATQLQFDDDEESVIDDEENVSSGNRNNGDGGTHQLSNLPVSRTPRIADTSNDELMDSPTRRAKKRTSQQKKYDGKRSWGEEEKNAIVEGIRLHGLGNWAAIKSEFDILFAMRTSGQIKDCYRRMLSKGEIPKALLPPKNTGGEKDAAVVVVGGENDVSAANRGKENQPS